MIKIAVAGTPSCCEKPEEGIKWLGSKGLHHEVAFVRQVWMKSDRAKEFGELAKNNKVDLSIHAPYYINLNSDKPETVEKSKQFILHSAEIGNYMRANIVVYHPGYYLKQKPEDVYKIMLKQHEEMSSSLKENKIKTLLGAETTGRQSQFGTLNELLELCQNFDNILPVIDFSHIHARGNGCMKTQKDFADVLNKVESKIGKFHIHSHFSGINYKDGNEKNHLPLSEADINFSLLAKELNERDIDITIVCESPLQEVDALTMLKTI